MQNQGLHDLCADAMDRVQRTAWILKDKPDPAAPDAGEFSCRGCQQVLAPEQYLTGHRGGRRQQPKGAEPRH